MVHMLYDGLKHAKHVRNYMQHAHGHVDVKNAYKFLRIVHVWDHRKAIGQNI